MNSKDRNLHQWYFHRNRETVVSTSNDYTRNSEAHRMPFAIEILAAFVPPDSLDKKTPSGGISTHTPLHELIMINTQTQILSKHFTQTTHHLTLFMKIHGENT